MFQIFTSHKRAMNALFEKILLLKIKKTDRRLNLIGHVSLIFFFDFSYERIELFTN